MSSHACGLWLMCHVCCCFVLLRSGFSLLPPLRLVASVFFPLGILLLLSSSPLRLVVFLTAQHQWLHKRMSLRLALLLAVAMWTMPHVH